MDIWLILGATFLGTIFGGVLAMYVLNKHFNKMVDDMKRQRPDFDEVLGRPRDYDRRR